MNVQLRVADGALNTRDYAPMNATRAPRSKPAGHAPGMPALIAIATKASLTASELHSTLTNARDEVEAAQADHDRAEHTYKAGLLQLDETTLAKTVQGKQAALIRRDRARALVEALEDRLTEFDAGEAEAKRRAAYADAKSKAGAAVKAIRGEYPRAARLIRTVLRQIAEAEVAIAAVNGDLPAGGEALTSPEDMVRSELPKQKVVLSETDVMLWCQEGTWLPVPDQYQSQISAGPDGRGVRRHGDESGYGPGASYGYVRRAFRRVEYLPSTLPVWADKLASKITLPGFHHYDENFWHESWGPGPPDFNQQRVLAMLDETEIEGGADSRVDPNDDDREPEIEYVPIGDTTEREAA